MNPRTGHEALLDAVVEATPALYLLPIDGVLRVFISAKEFAAMCSIPVNRVYQLIRDGQIAVVDEFRASGPRIPVNELLRWQQMARRQVA